MKERQPKAHVNKEQIEPDTIRADLEEADLQQAQEVTNTHLYEVTPKELPFSGKMDIESVDGWNFFEGSEAVYVNDPSEPDRAMDNFLPRTLAQAQLRIPRTKNKLRKQNFNQQLIRNKEPIPIWPIGESRFHAIDSEVMVFDGGQLWGTVQTDEQFVSFPETILFN